MSEPATPTRILRKPVVVDRVGLSATTIWRLYKSNRFPSPIQLSPGAVGWREADVQRWLDTRESR